MVVLRVDGGKALVLVNDQLMLGQLELSDGGLQPGLAIVVGFDRPPLSAVAPAKVELRELNEPQLGPPAPGAVWIEPYPPI